MWLFWRGDDCPEEGDHGRVLLRQISEAQEELDCSKKLKQGSESRLVQANEINAALIEQIKNIRENADKKDSADRVVARYHGEDARPREVVSAAVVATTTVTVTDGSA